jgi:hypothetical protein
MKDGNNKAIMEKGQASAHPTNGVVEDEGKRAEAFGLPWKLCFWRPA